MYYGTRRLILTELAAILLGIVQHFFYQWAPNIVTALIAPVNESLWEHSKLVFWPFLLAALFLNWGRPKGIRPWLLVLPAMIGLMLLLGYLYNVVWMGTASWVNIGIYILVMVLGFWLATRSSNPITGLLWYLALGLTIGLGVALVVFTLYPPDLILFQELSPMGAWYSLPC